MVPLIVIGAARSGTKLVRDAIAAHPQVARVPYDVNYLWRLGHEHVAHDELDPGQLGVEDLGRIRKSIAAFAAGRPVLVEKTVSNCLRVPFVRAVFPEARYLHLVRDGWDVVESVYRQWLAPPDLRYLVGKTREFPWILTWRYALRAGGDVLRRLVRPRDRRIVAWGPRYRGIEDDLARRDVLEVCAIQWFKSVTYAVRELRALPADRVLVVRYEDFVRQPQAHLNAIASFVALDPAPYARAALDTSISTANVGKGRRNLTERQAAVVEPWIGSLLGGLPASSVIDAAERIGEVHR